MKLTHHPRPGVEWHYDPTRTYDAIDGGYKPRGLWLSVDGDWRRWCEDEEMEWVDDAEVEFTISDPERVLWLRDADDIDQFTAEWTSFARWERRPDWKRLRTAGWAGLMIAPYCWERRLSDYTFWYYGWDCASACVWDLSVLTMEQP